MMFCSRGGIATENYRRPKHAKTQKIVGQALRLPDRNRWQAERLPYNVRLIFVAAVYDRRKHFIDDLS
jgi:hypothetical protein